MKKNVRVLFVLMALSGMMNCFLLEPALAAQEETVCLSDDGCDCCFVCCSFSHQILQKTVVPFNPSMNISVFIPSSIPVPQDIPASSIFHPPLLR